MGGERQCNIYVCVSKRERPTESDSPSLELWAALSLPVSAYLCVCVSIRVCVKKMESSEI